MTQFADRGYRAVFFDLDGTLVDTAPDMVNVLQDLQREYGFEPVSYDVGRSYVSNGALGLLRLGFPDLDDDACADLHPSYLERYAQTVCQDSSVFPGVDTLLRDLEAARIPWGIVTNKPSYLTGELLDHLQLADRATCTVSGDTVAEKKPHPAPLLHACEITGVDAQESMYVGDAARDIEAGRAAGMGTIAAAYGYIPPGDSALDWGADRVAKDTQELAQIVLKAVNLDA